MRGIFILTLLKSFTIMKVLLDIKDENAASLMEVLKGLSYVKAKPLTASKAAFLEDLKEAVDEVKLAKKGKIKLKSFDSFLNEL